MEVHDCMWGVGVDVPQPFHLPDGPAWLEELGHFMGFIADL